MKRKVFEEPKLILSRGGKRKSKKLILVSMGKTSKIKKGCKPSSSRPLIKPRFIPHICVREDDCPKCKDYINRLQAYREQ